MLYTWAQFTQYLRLARARKAEDQAAQLLLMNHATAGGEGATALLKKLHKQADQV